MCSHAFMTGAPTTFVLPDLAGVTVVATVTGNVPTVTATIGRALTANEALMYWITNGTLSGRKIQKADYRLVNLWNSSDYPSPRNLGPDMIGRWPNATWSVGQKYGGLVMGLNALTGATTAPTSFQFTLAAP